MDCMAKAIETSSVVIICITERYKDSENCRSGNTINAQSVLNDIHKFSYLFPKYQTLMWR